MRHADDEQRLIAAYRAETAPSAATEDALLERLLDAPGEDAPVEPWRWRRVGLAVGLTVAIAAAVLLLMRGGYVLLAEEERQVPDEAAYGASGQTGTRVESERHGDRSDREERSAPADTEQANPHTVGSPIPAEVDAAAGTSSQGPRRERSGSSVTPDAPVLDEATTLAEEAALLARAQAALRDGKPAEALHGLEEHARRFPDGAMSLERRSLQAVALCEAGRIDQGAPLARALLSSREPVPYGVRLRRACALG